jgi:hypothetical protein
VSASEIAKLLVGLNFNLFLHQGTSRRGRARDSYAKAAHFSFFLRTEYGVLVEVTTTPGWASGDGRSVGRGGGLGCLGIIAPGTSSCS